ncbi:MAG: quinolinate synthase NadA [Sandaracinaceae bacterium]|nr:quinolinate synthase NadA [Sandaracinaceae bacterium]
MKAPSCEFTWQIVDRGALFKHMAFSTPLPSIRISRNGIEAQGSFAEAQAAYLTPDSATVRELEGLLRLKGFGVVAHYYMDPELQGVLMALNWPFVHIADSLSMAEKALAMVDGSLGHPPAQGVVVLGVDFMSESVRLTLLRAGYGHIPVYRVRADPIGCSLAEAAEGPSYLAFLEKAARRPRSLHVIYVNTSLRTKAEAQRRLPTITVTSSNVVRTVLAAFAEIPGVEVFFGPDTYMGRNIASLFRHLIELGDEAVQRIHPAHNAKTLANALERFHVFPGGHCIVHHQFDSRIAEYIRKECNHALIAAHLEVPGEMFELALERQHEGRGVVGSTSDILAFITRTVHSAITAQQKGVLSFVLATESGMTASIVGAVRKLLRAHPDADLSCEILFPVAKEAIHRGDTKQEATLKVLPGAPSSEGCSLGGGCATCPYMKMNSLDALFELLRMLPSDGKVPSFVGSYAALVRVPQEQVETLSLLASEPIAHMRAFQSTGHIPESLRRAVLERPLGQEFLGLDSP